MKNWIGWLAFVLCLTLQANGALAERLTHPRYLTTPEEKDSTWRLIETEPWAKEVYTRLKQRTDRYLIRVKEQPDWLYARLAMYWHSHATEVYIKGESFDHVGGEKAPVPTVRFTGTRGTFATHGRPKLEEVLPYDDDEQSRVTFCNKSLPGQPMEKVHVAKTGRNVESLNREIMGIARDAAFLYWLTDDVDYAALAAGVFDTYMQGIYYRNVPTDLNYGHQQTLVGMSSFEVIHEDILNEIVPLYDFLYPYLAQHYADHMPRYAGAFKKWADNIIANGVPHNNWNLMQARYVMNIGLVLEEDAAYPDGKGRDYYIDYVVNRSSIRQWSLKQLAAYGYDAHTGIWAECPGYSGVVLNDYANFTRLFDRNLHTDLTRELPVIPLAVAATPQYLFPNRMICGWGDTHPSYLNTTPVVRMIQNAKAHGKREQEEFFTALLRCLDPLAAVPAAKKPSVAVTSFFEDKPLVLRPETEAGRIEEYVSPLFYAPNVSWLAQRNGMDSRHSLMASLNGSLGNHMHANGISLELYGKGFVLGPDAGIGQYLYSGLDYAEYYSQFPAHNTVCVDGISSYPVMKSHHDFRLRSCFPAVGCKKGLFSPLTYSELSFREPESQADQTRLTGIVTVDSLSGYYVDIFRSRKAEGGDKMHDYFYHNLGQAMQLTAADGDTLGLQPTEELAFAGAHLSAYSYLYNKEMAATEKDAKVAFLTKMKDGDDITMTLWMKGGSQRQLFRALAPMTEGYSRTPGMPYAVKEQPTLTFVARQQGEAWNRPFVALYEPSSVKEPVQVVAVRYPAVRSKEQGSHVAMEVTLRNGATDHILAADEASHHLATDHLQAAASYAFCREREGVAELVLMGHGTWLKASGVTLQAAQPGEVMLWRKAGVWYYQASVPVRVEVQGRKYRLPESEFILPISGR